MAHNRCAIRSLVLALLLALSIVSLHAAGMNRVFGYALTHPGGLPAPGATVTVYLSGGIVPAVLYTKADGSQGLANPFVADVNGFFDFYTIAQKVDVQISGTGIATPYTLGDVVVLPQVPSLAFSAFPTPSLTDKGSLVQRTDTPQGLWYDTGSAWAPLVSGASVSSVYTFGALCDGVTDDHVAIQAALTAGGVVQIPEATCSIAASTLTIPNGVTLRGVSYTTSVLAYSGTGDAIKYVGDHVNSSGFARVNIWDLAIIGSGANSTGAAIDISAWGWAYFDIERVSILPTVSTINAFQYGIILDGAELAKVTKCLIANGKPNTTGDVNVWLTSGNEHTAGQAAGYTNVVQITDNQIANAEIGVLDDGGNNHQIANNNFDANAEMAHVAGVEGLRFTNNVLEHTQIGGGAILDAADVVVTDASTITGCPGGCLPLNKGPVTGGIIEGNLFDGNIAASGTNGSTGALLQFATANAQWHTGISISGNYFSFVQNMGAAVDVSALRWSFVGSNFNYGSATLGTGPFNHFYTGVTNGANGNILWPGPWSSDVPLGGGAPLFGQTTQPVILAGGLQVGTTGTGVTQLLSEATPWVVPDMPSTNPISKTIAFGTLGDTCNASIKVTAGPAGLPAGVFISCAVTSTGTTTVSLTNQSGGDVNLGASTLRVDLWSH